MQLLARAGPTSTVLSPDRRRVAAFDLEGRLLTYFRDGSFYKRSLGSDLFERHRTEVTRWRRLEPPATQRIFAESVELAREVETDDELLQTRLAGIERWEPERLLAERDRFASTYEPISILPPDRYLSVVLQATKGCTWNRCTFCSFYQGRPFSARSREELTRHAREVRLLLGRDLARRRGVFLADGNALALSRRRLLPYFEVANEYFPGQEIWSFVDLYSGERHDSADWPELRDRGLAGVYIGMETGLDELLAFVDKPGSQEDLVSFVHELKAAEITIGLIVMVGLGGRHYRERHGQATLEALQEMKLGAEDLVYLSPFVEHPGSRYAERRGHQGLEPMSRPEVEEELQRLARSVRELGVRAGRYDIREFVY